jgi:uncharacterized oxidoreductase
MNLMGNAIFITGGGSGIGRGFAETLQGKGNKVIVSRRRKSALEEAGRANPGIEFVELDIENPKRIASVANSLVKRHPELNVLINKAGTMKVDNVQNGSRGERYDVCNYWNHWQRWRQRSA